MADILVLGAEAQAAVSIALAYPERAVTFVSDDAILDGWDLPNVRMQFGRPADRGSLAHGVEQVVPLSPRWLAQEAVLPLTQTFPEIERSLPGRTLAVCSRPGAEGLWILKGERWHRPDAPLSGTPHQLEDVTDPHGCGLVYQMLVESSGTIMAIGRRGSGTQLGCVQVFEERYFWDNILQAGETIDAPDVLEATLEVLDALDHQGFFALNWLRTPHGLRLTSLRPAPRAIFQMYRRGGIDLLADPTGVGVVPAGVRMIAAPTYVSYRRLEA